MIVDASDFRRAGAIMAAEADAGKLRWRLASRLRGAAEPILGEQRSRLNSAGGSGNTGGLVGGSILDAIKSSLTVASSFTGTSAGVRIRSKTTPQLRHFKQAPRRFNQNSFRHPLFGNRERWYDQVGAPGWFHEPALAHRPQFLAACTTEMSDMAMDVAIRVRSANGHP